MLTKKGTIKKTPLSAFSNPRPSGIIALTIDLEDDLLAAKISEGNNAALLGEYFRLEMKTLCEQSDIAVSVRGKGLLNALIINNKNKKDLAWDICLKLAENGLLAKPTHTNIIRFAPPLIITREQMDESLEIIRKTILEF